MIHLDNSNLSTILALLYLAGFLGIVLGITFLFVRGLMWMFDKFEAWESKRRVRRLILARVSQHGSPPSDLKGK